MPLCVVGFILETITERGCSLVSEVGCLARASICNCVGPGDESCAYYLQGLGTSERKRSRVVSEMLQFFLLLALQFTMNSHADGCASLCLLCVG